METTRVTNPISLAPNLETSEFQAAQAARGSTGPNLGELLPAGTSVSEEIRTVFDLGQTMDGTLMSLVAQACSNPELRQTAKFNAALRKTLTQLAKSSSPEGRKAAELLKDLQNDQDLLANYRATLLG